MPRKQRWVVRVVTSRDGSREEKALNETALLECLRYAGIAHVHRRDETGVCFDLYAPRTVDSKVWADQNSERMSGFGLNAVSAPEYPAP